MRFAAPYGIHTNLRALEAVLQDIRQAEVGHVVVRGDVGPMPPPRRKMHCEMERVGIPGLEIAGIICRYALCTVQPGAGDHGHVRGKN